MSSPMKSPLMSRTPEQLKVPELKEELKRRGLSIKGLKKDLVERLESAVNEESAAAAAVAAEKITAARIVDQVEPVFEKEELVMEAETVVQVVEQFDQPQATEPVVEKEMVVTETETMVEVLEEVTSAQQATEPVVEEKGKEEMMVTETETSVVETVEVTSLNQATGVTTVNVEEESVVKTVTETAVMPEAEQAEITTMIPAVAEDGTVAEEKSVTESVLEIETTKVEEEVLEQSVTAEGESVVEKTVSEEVQTTVVVEEVTEQQELKDGMEVVKESVLDKEEDQDSKADSEELPESAVTDKVEDSRPMDVDAEAQAGLKRKEGGGEVQQVDQNKRQRKWNSGAEAEARPKVSSDLTVNVASNVAGSNNLGSRPLADRRPVAAHSENGRVVSPSSTKPTTSLRVDRFVRPFTLKALKDLLAETGSVSDFWMDQIKTHCYVTFSSIDEAVATKNALQNLKWPVVGGKHLTVEFVEPEEVKRKCENGTNERPAAVTTPRAFTSPAAPSTPPAAAAAAAAAVQREKTAAQPKREAEPIVTLDDLFKKTSVKPNIYYLPLTEEQVAAKLVKT